MDASALATGAVFVVVALCTIIPLMTWMDRHGVGHEKDTWLPGPRAKRILDTLDRIDATLARIEQRLDDVVPPR